MKEIEVQQVVNCMRASALEKSYIVVNGKKKVTLDSVVVIPQMWNKYSNSPVITIEAFEDVKGTHLILHLKEEKEERK